MVGRTVTHYKVVEKLGEGGMGVVYRAEDTKLRRVVALKFLPTESLADEDSKARFLHEAQAAASLHHPHICGVYEIEEAEGRLFMAMPFVEGRSLDKRIAEGPRPLGEVLAVTVQTAEALEEAHGKQIVHRDIKPGNVMVSERGRGRLHCVLMDFGLARLSHATKLTREGSRLGTAAYMSPEQVEGSAVDYRSDVWSLGVVMYEMTVGQLPFPADYEQALFYGILNEQPQPVTALRTGVPMELERIVGKCLAKDPNERYQSCTDLLVDLHTVERVLESRSSRPTTVTSDLPASAAASAQRAPSRETEQPSVAPSVAPAPGSAAETDPTPRRFSLPQVGFVSLTLAAVVAGVTWWLNRPQPPASAKTEYELTRITWEGGLAGFPALSPDGRLLAYASDRAGRGDLDIWVQQVEGGSIAQVTSDPADEFEPSFSPDGTKIAFFRWASGGESDVVGVYVVPTLGGDAYLVAEGAVDPSFGPDGKTVAYLRDGRGGKLYYSSISMGEPQQLVPGFEHLGPPVWTSDGSHIIVHASRKDEPEDWWAVPLDGSEPKRLNAREALREGGHVLPHPESWSWSNEGLLFGMNGDLYRAPVDRRSWRVRPPERLTFGSGVEVDPSGSNDGKIVFWDAEQRRDIWSLKLNPRTGAAVGELERLTETVSSDTAGDISPDGRRLIYISNRWGKSDIWSRDLVSGKEANLTNDGVRQIQPVLRPDGESLAYLVHEEKRPAIYVRPYAGGVGRRLCEDCGAPRSWSPDGRFLLFDRGDTSSIHALDVESGEHSEILNCQGGSLRFGRIDPSGQWVAFRAAGDACGPGLFVASFRGAEPIAREKWLEITSVRSDDEPAWAPSGRILYFLSGRAGTRDIWMQRLNPATKTPAGDPQLVRRFHSVRYSNQFMTAEDQRLAVAKDRLVFPMSELSGSIWLMEPKSAAEGR